MPNEQVKFLFVADVMEILGISQSLAYRIMRDINKELEAEGYITIAGRVFRQRFYERFYCGSAAAPASDRTEKPPRPRKSSRST